MRRDPTNDVPPLADDLAPGMNPMEGAVVLPRAPERAESRKSPFPTMWEGEEKEVVLYNGDLSKCTKEHSAETVRALRRMLPSPVGTSPVWKGLEYYQENPEDLFRDMVHLANYKVVQVVRIQNQKRYQLWAAHIDAYEIEMADTVKVYHGTTGPAAQSICNTGFRGGFCKRGMFGKGVYSTRNVWEALAYAAPDELGNQTFLVAYLARGPTALGSIDQTDFGMTPEGKEINTLTSPSGTILCAQYENQLMVGYRVTLNYCNERQHTEEHFKVVGIYHPTIFNSYVRPPLASESIPDLKKSNGFEVGDKVVLNRSCSDKVFAFAKGQSGTIAKIIRTGSPSQPTIRFMIKLDDRNHDAAIKAGYSQAVDAATRWTDTEDTWIAAVLKGIQKVDPASGAASRLASFAASQMAAAGSSAQQPVVVTWTPIWQTEYSRRRDKERVLFEVDTRVHISSPHNKGLGIFNRFFGEKGTIKAIFKGGDGGNVHFCIELDDHLEGIHIKMNCRKQAWKFPGQEDNTNSKFQGQGHDTATWLVVTSGFVEKLDAAVGEKRKADGNP